MALANGSSATNQISNGSSVTDDGSSLGSAHFVAPDSGPVTVNADPASGKAAIVDFTDGITDQNLWFVQSGNDLKIDVLGTNTSITEKDWFSRTANQPQQIRAGNLEIDGQISQLVQAMASYSASQPGFDPTGSSIHTIPNDSSLQNTIAAAWHHS